MQAPLFSEPEHQPTHRRTPILWGAVALFVLVGIGAGIYLMQRPGRGPFRSSNRNQNAFRQAQVLSRGGFGSVAVQYYTIALQQNPNLPAAYRERGILNEELNRPRLAVADLTEAIRRQPTDAIAYMYRADAYHALGENDLAFKDFAEAIRLQPSDPHLYVHRGNLYARLGNYTEADADYTRAIDLNPSAMYIYNFRYAARYAAGDTDGAGRDKAILNKFHPEEQGGSEPADDDVGDMEK